jgi:hypothetical protein
MAGVREITRESQPEALGASSMTIRIIQILNSQVSRERVNASKNPKLPTKKTAGLERNQTLRCGSGQVRVR